jgi:protein arginine kinase activator
MLCQNCHKKKATVRYAEVVDGGVTEQHLCQDCLELRQKTGLSGFEFSTPEPYRSQRDAERASLSDTVADLESCKVCNTRLRTVLEQAKVGCSKCYESFSKELEGMLEGMHVGLIHRGKTPHHDDARTQTRQELQSKRALLKTALRTESYEEAAALRDQIRNLEMGLDASVAGTE